MQRAAVLVLFGPRDGNPAPAPSELSQIRPETASVLLLKRSLELRFAAGQVAFPGGMIDPGEDAIAAAIRETQEETGALPAGIDVLEVGPPHQMGSGGLSVTPVLAWWSTPSPVWAVDPQETSAVFTVPVATLLDPRTRFTAVYGSLRGRLGHRGPGWLVAVDEGEQLIWGFTARVLDGLFDDLGWTQPWDQGRVLPLNDAGTAVLSGYDRD